MEKRFFARAIGRVQGVGFRMFVQMNARKKNLTGWVKNMPDGSVTMEFQGEETAIADFRAQVMRGNFFIRVESLQEEARELLAEECAFEIR